MQGVLDLSFRVSEGQSPEVVDDEWCETRCTEAPHFEPWVGGVDVGEESNDKEIHCLDKIVHQRNDRTQLSLIYDPVVIGLQSAKVYVFSDSVLCLGKVPECNEAWKERVARIRAEKSCRDLECQWRVYGIRVAGFTTL